jgi:hypothetical protein
MSGKADEANEANEANESMILISTHYIANQLIFVFSEHFMWFPEQSHRLSGITISL